MSSINKKRTTISCSLGFQGESSVEVDDENDEKLAASTQFLSTQRNRKIEL